MRPAILHPSWLSRNLVLCGIVLLLARWVFSLNDTGATRVEPGPAASDATPQLNREGELSQKHSQAMELLARLEEAVRKDGEVPSLLSSLSMVREEIEPIRLEILGYLDEVGGHCVKAGLDPVILSRHEQAVESFGQAMGSLLGALDGVAQIAAATRSDLDLDGDVDQGDFGLLQACVTGPNIGPPAAGCEKADLDGDGDIDQSDFGLLQRQLGGAAGNLLEAVQSARTVVGELVFKAEAPIHNAQPSLWKPLPPAAAPAAEGDPELPGINAAAAAMAAGPPVPGDLLPTIDVLMTQEVIDKAAELGGNAQAFYEFVRNECEFQPYLGSRKGSIETLRQRAGNDYDLASLLIALLRAAGIPARYAVGMVEMTPDRTRSWLGVDDSRVAGSILTTQGMEGLTIYQGTPDNIVAVRCRRVWVEAWVARGRGEPTWVPLDPAFKLHDIDPGIDIPAEMGFDAQSFVEEYYAPATPGVVLPRPETLLELFRQQISDYLAVHYPGETVQSVMRSQTIAPETLGELPASLPYKVRTRDTQYSEVPAVKRYQVRFHLHNGGTTLINHTLNLPAVAGKRITIGYVAATPADQAVLDTYGGIYQTPPHLVNLTPVLRVAGQDAATGAAGVGMGRVHSSDIHFLAPAGTSNPVPAIYNDIVCGADQAIGLAVEGISESMLVPPPADDTEGTAQLLYDVAMDYMARCHAADMEAGRLMHDFITTDVADAIVENVVNVSYNGYGTPMSFTWKALRVDADRSILGIWPVDRMDPADGEPKDVMLLTGAEGSLWESRIYEDGFGQDSVSTIKILELAKAAGITVYKRWSTLPLPANTLPSSARTAIQNAIAGGHAVTFPASQITAGTPATGQWTGLGWIDLDPATGAAGYIISGNNNGGATVETWPPEFIDLSNGDRRVTRVEIKMKGGDSPVGDSPDPNAVYTRDTEQNLIFEYQVHVYYDDGSDKWLPGSGSYYQRKTRNTTKTFVPGNYTFTVWISRWWWWFGTVAEAERKVSIAGVLIRTDDGTDIGEDPPPSIPLKTDFSTHTPSVDLKLLVIPEKAPNGSMLASSYRWQTAAAPKLKVVSQSQLRTKVEPRDQTPSAVVDDQLLDAEVALPGSKKAHAFRKFKYARGGSDEQYKLTVIKLDFAKGATVGWGFDEYAASQPDPKHHYVSIRKSSAAQVLLNSTPAGAKFHVALTSQDKATALVAPLTTANSPEIVTISGQSKDKATTFIDARFPDDSGEIVARIGAGVYKQHSATNVKAFSVKDSTSAGTALGQNVSAADIQTYTNDIFKQGVMDVTIAGSAGETDIAYDDNKNGILDLEPGTVSSEEQKVRNGAAYAGTRLIYVHELRWNYYLAANAPAGSNTITLSNYGGYFDYIVPGSSYTLQDGATSEVITVQSVNSAARQVTLTAGLTHAYSSGTGALIWPLGGLSGNPTYAYDGGSADLIKNVFAHEIGHTFGTLHDVSDGNNVMYHTAGIRKELRHRPQTKYYGGGGLEEQWNTLPR
jgi:hypothetical protein